VPPKPIRALRQLTRYRKTQIKERQREANRLRKALEDSGIQLDCGASDILGVSGGAMLDALCAGTTDPQVLADLARGKLRKKIPALRAALEGRFEPLHALLVGSILAHLDFLDEQVERLSEAIEEQLRPFAAAVELLCSIDGIQMRTAQNILAEIGTDMSLFHSGRRPQLAGGVWHADGRGRRLESARGYHHPAWVAAPSIWSVVAGAITYLHYIYSAKVTGRSRRLQEVRVAHVITPRAACRRLP
jgi:transposase